MALNNTVFSLVVLSMLILTGCSSKNDPESQVFLDKIINHFSSSEKTILLSNITDFKWERVCAYYADDSTPNATRDWLDQKTGQKGHASDHAPMALIFVTSDSKSKVYIFENTHFKIDNRPYYFASVTDSGDNYGEACFDVSEANLKRTSGVSKYPAIELKKGE